MIFDTLENIEKYKGIYNNLDTVIDFIKDGKIKSLISGKNLINGEDIYANCNMEAKTVNEADGVYEMHKKYLDLHIDLEGSEKILFTVYSKEKEINSYVEEGDYVLLNGNKNVECLLDKNHFVICMTQEPHMPCVRVDNKDSISKVIFKIKAE